MVLYYLIRDVVRGANCSYPAGRTLLREAGFLFSDEAQRVADDYNRHCNVAGVCYLVLPHPEDKPVQADHYENATPSDFAQENTAALPRYYVSVSDEDGELVANQILPEQVACTIRAAVTRGMTSGTVLHNRAYRGVDGVHPELHCWSLS